MYRFQVSAHTTMGESIGVLGSVPELGSWDISRCLLLQTQRDQYPRWSVDVVIRSVAADVVTSDRIYYKYVRFSPEGEVTWEALGPNRWVPFPSSFHPSVVIVDDGNFGEIQPWPYAYSEVPVEHPLLPLGPGGLKIAILGSSVALGCSAWLLQGWAWRLEQALHQQYGHQVMNCSALGANTKTAVDQFQQCVVPYQPDVVVIALSLGNEGFAYCLPQHRAVVQQRFENGLQQLVRLVREIGAVPILGSVYPHRDYTSEHDRYLQETHRRMLTWGVPVLDWLTVLNDGQGRWKPGISFDVGHPNSEGHRLMYEAIALSLFDPQHLIRSSTPPAYSSLVL